MSWQSLTTKLPLERLQNEDIPPDFEDSFQSWKNLSFLSSLSRRQTLKLCGVDLIYCFPVESLWTYHSTSKCTAFLVSERWMSLACRVKLVTGGGGWTAVMLIPPMARCEGKCHDFQCWFLWCKYWYGGHFINNKVILLAWSLGRDVLSFSIPIIDIGRWDSFIQQVQ